MERILITLYDTENNDSEITWYYASAVPLPGECIWIKDNEKSACHMKHHIMRREWDLIIISKEKKIIHASLYVRRLGLLKVAKRKKEKQMREYKDCRHCGWWRKRNSSRKGVSIPDGTGKCTRPEGHCDPDIVKGKIGEGPIVRHTTTN